jgi:hypothetical protein
VHPRIPSQYVRVKVSPLTGSGLQEVLQSVLRPWSWQMPLSHRPVVPQVLGASLGQRASAVLFGTAVQVPSLFATRQLWQVPQEASPQQTPSVQWVLPHSPSRPHGVPSVSFDAQWPVPSQ